jgi:nicotinamidase-related amidase
MKTLLVIDMQQAWLESERFEKEQVLARIEFAANQIRQQQGKVIFIQHCNEQAPSGSAGWQLADNLTVTTKDFLIDKTACDSFVGTSLLACLTELGTTELYICGLATEFCVDTTLRAAVSAGYSVVALSDAHTTGDRPHLTAAQIVEHHNWVWQNLAIPRGQQLQVRTVAEAFPTDLKSTSR